MKRTVFITGGARSGKSAFAEKLADEFDGEKIYIATAELRDEEMAERIKAHQMRRGDGWKTLEEPVMLADAIDKAVMPDRLVLVDCLTLWLSNLMERGADIDEAFSQLCEVIEGARGTLLIVSNETGLGIVPENKLARQFRDLSGIMNQQIATVCQEAYLVAAGLPLRLK